MTYSRYVALGDSQTEGIGDGDDTSGHRGWADRLAEHLAAVNPELRYANLAVRGRLAGQVRAEQLEPALRLQPDLASVVAGLNDLIRPGFDAARIAATLEDMFAALTSAGAQVVTVTYPDVTAIAPLVRRLSPRVHDFNTRIHDAAARHGVTVVEAPAAFATDPRLWCADRLHLSSLGHTMAAAEIARKLGLPTTADQPLPPLPPPATWRVVATELRWLATFVGPWLYRRARGRSSGDGRTPKRPALTPVR
ncbi:SGNH/GDSL hydrolase family protein [Pseudonocardia acaciae]|uniref:SGNH/GDSL hydrolase family protein n=1 Tax=Pseudonocardia acaciae TaxID=551276 RepID=UPI00048C9559|nr:SGNH/GDSL hydrolase family protein [Pseudonocardia acaciae]